MKKLLFYTILFFTVFGYVNIFQQNTFLKNTNVLNPSCKIKGNISISSGNKIYHVPGQQDYENTRIQPEHGEKWFCSEEEAIKAGWRKAPR